MADQRLITENTARTAAGLSAAGMAHAYFKHDAARRLGDTTTESANVPRAKTAHVSERNSLAHYASEDGPLVNKYMRDGSVKAVKSKSLARITYGDAKGAVRVERESLMRRTSSDVTRVLNRTQMPEGTKLYRATGTKHIQGGLKPGSVIGDAGVMSTTSSVKSAHVFHGMAARHKTAPVTMIIDAGGARGASMGTSARFQAEREVALAPGTKATVTSIEKGVKRGLFDTSRDYAHATTKTPARMGGVRSSGAAHRINNIAGKAGVGLAIAAPVVAGINQYNRSRAAGADTNEAARAAHGAAVVTAALGGATALGISGVAKLALKAAPRLAPALGPIGWAAAAGMAGYGAYQGYQNTGTVTGALKGAVGLDTAPTQSTDAITNALSGMQKLSRPPLDTGKPGKQSSFGAGEARAFESANAAFGAEAVRGMNAEAEKIKGGPKGWANPGTQMAAQAARGVTNFTDWAAAGKASA